MSAKRIPVNVTVEVSRRCPLNCSHCYNNLPMADLETAKRELSYEEHCRVLDELADLGCFWLLFTGGEIFARRDFLDIYTYAKKKGFIITLFTNGTMITPKIADYLAEWRPFSIEITLYGRTKETYERLTRVPGSYERCIHGIQLLKERGLPLSLKSVAVSVNKHEIWDMKKYVEEDLGLAFKFDAMINGRIDCSLSPLEVRLTPEEIVDLDLHDPARVKEWDRFSSQFAGPAHPVGKEDELYHCGGGVNSFAIDPLGKMSICVLSHQNEYDIRQGSVRKGWEHFLLAVRAKKAVRITKCTACQIKAVCGMCPANAELEAGDSETPVDFLCHTAHLRAHTMGWSVPEHGECDYCKGGSEFDRVRAEAGRLVSGSPRPSRPAFALLPVMMAEGSLPFAGGCNGCGGH
jgi:radical SAM protein with 4Fe4S-binding SPASM domain